MNIQPELAHTHKGYLKIVGSLILCHLALMVDSTLTGPRSSLLFSTLQEALKGQVWLVTAIHGLSALLLIVGLYWSRMFVLVRLGAALSLFTFNALAITFLVSARDNDLSYFAAIVSVTLSLSSAAAINEPVDRDRRHVDEAVVPERRKAPNEKDQ